MCVQNWSQIASPENGKKQNETTNSIIIKMVWRHLWVVTQFLLGAELQSCGFLTELSDVWFGVYKGLITAPSNVCLFMSHSRSISTNLSLRYVA